MHEDVLGDLTRISKQEYPSEYDLHIDLSRTLKRLQDGHCVWINACYDSVFVNFLPTPLVLLTDSNGSQNVHIAPEAFEVASAEFGDEIEVWQNALPRSLKGQLSTASFDSVLCRMFLFMTSSAAFWCQSPPHQWTGPMGSCGCQCFDNR